MTAAMPRFRPTEPLPGPQTTWPSRHSALAALEAAGWPSRRRERWRYTDLEPLASSAFELAPSAPGAAELNSAASLLDSLALESPQRLVFVDGHPAPGLGAVTLQGLEIETLEHGWNQFQSQFAGRIVTAEHPLSALNTAFIQHGLSIHAVAGMAVEQPLHLVFIGSARAALAPQPRIVIDLAAGAKLTVVQHFIDVGPGTGWLNAVTQIRQASGSRLDMYRLQQHGAQQAHTSVLAAELAADAEISVGYIDLGGRLVRNDLDVALMEPGARAELFGLFLAGAGQHVDDHTRIDHAAPQTHSDEAFRGIVASQGHGVFNGKVIVRPNAQRIDARQSNDNLLLGDQAEIDAKPELEIYADDVKCSHGCTVGELDAEQLFYLQARGIGAAAARELLTAAFAATVLERIRHEPLRAQLLERVAARLRSLTEHAS